MEFNMKKVKFLTEGASSQTGKDRLRKGIQIALAGTMLVSGMANAVLRDHGPLNATWFPDWYRDTNGLAMGQCIYADDGGNGPLCLTGPADTNPNGFPGNIGDEAFYSATDISIPITGGSFLWLGHLEMAYGSASGSPPAVRNNTTPATEIVFSRERMRIDIPTTNDGSCAGQYTIRTPFGVHTLDMEEGPRALFYTDDIQPINGDYNAVLAGHTGPFLTWDVGADLVNPVSSTNPVVAITPPVGPVRKYVGDPNQLHTFVGSTVPAGPRHLDKGFNNYVEIKPPTACDLGAGPGEPLFEDTAAVSGLMWDLPIADPTTITKATYTRSGTTVGLDVWATASKNQNLVLTAADSDTQHVPSVTMSEETKPNGTGFYHAHLEFDAGQNLPSQVSVANLTSNPVARDKAVVVDEVVVTKSTYDSVSKKLCITAHSGDEISPVPLRLEAPGYGAFGAATAGCPVVASNDVVLEKDLNDFNPDFRIPPEGILIKSDRGGQETSQPSIIKTGVLDALNIRAVDDLFTGINGTGVTPLNLVVANPTTADTTPANYRIVVVSQPEVGTVTAPASGGTVSYAAVEGMATSTQTFYYAIQDVSDESVSNVARVDLSITQVIPPPVGVADLQGVFRTSAGSTINVLANDVTGLTSTAIDPTSIQIATAPGRGTATVVGNAITYTPSAGQSATANNTLDTFTYTVANVAGSRSTPITVQVVLKQAAEAVTFQRVRFNNAWDIRFTSSYAGVAGSVTLAPTASCALVTNPGAPTRVGPIGGVVSVTPGANNYVVGGGTPVPSGNNWTVRCTTSSGGIQNRTGTL
jgi:hypothetical protein